jgi:hypothetical protein
MWTIDMTPSTFRQLVVANLIVPVIGIALDLMLSPSTYDGQPFTKSDAILVGIGLLAIVLMVMTTIGLCRFARWSRPLVLWLTVVGLVWIVFDSPYQAHAFAEAMYELSSLLTGAVLAAAYWSPVSRLFEPGRAEEDLQEVFR